jgi:DNA-directed RNA polymerase specialized sigma24 family protein
VHKKRKPEALTTPGLSEFHNHYRTGTQMQYQNAPQGATTTYPDHPGYRRNAPETSREAAEAIAPMARNHRDQILAVFKEAYPESRSSEQIAAAIGISAYNVRPRVSELVAGGKVERTDDRVKNQGGRSVVLWRAA